MFDKDCLTYVTDHILKNKALSDVTPEYSEPLRIEILQMLALLVRFVFTKDLSHDTIKYAWNHYKHVEDLTAKLAAHFLLSRFIQLNDCPSKIVTQVFVDLLKTNQTEGRVLAKQALDVLTPILPKRLPSEGQKYPTWIKWVKKIVVEEGHSTTQLVLIWQLVVRHSELFYESREHFVPQMIHSLPRIGLAGNVPEQRKLTVDIAELILNWEKQRLGQTPESRKRAAEEMEGAMKRQKTETGAIRLDSPGTSNPSTPSTPVNPIPPTPTNPGASTEPEYRPGPALIEMVISFLIRFACSPNESPDKKVTNARCVSLLQDFLNPELFPDVSSKLNVFEKLFQQDETKDILSALGVMCVALDIMAVILRNRTNSSYWSNIPIAIKAVQRWASTEHTQLVDSLQPVISLILKASTEKVEEIDPKSTLFFILPFRPFIILIPNNTKIKQFCKS